MGLARAKWLVALALSGLALFTASACAQSPQAISVVAEGTATSTSERAECWIKPESVAEVTVTLNEPTMRMVILQMLAEDKHEKEVAWDGETNTATITLFTAGDTIPDEVLQAYARRATEVVDNIRAVVKAVDAAGNTTATASWQGEMIQSHLEAWVLLALNDGYCKGAAWHVDTNTMVVEVYSAGDVLSEEKLRDYEQRASEVAPDVNIVVEVNPGNPPTFDAAPEDKADEQS
ncbi:MAG: hypothetical protein LBC29_02555 [Propionibacteriaceae bacterium]|jgi:hypothetical protein|nr:hypothetical protein [Propionibacteriaceae bacterium]